MELEIKDYIKIIRKRLWLLLAIVLSASVATGIISYNFIRPVYGADVKLIVTKAEEIQGAQVIDYGSIDTNIKLINTYKEIMKTPAIMNKVVEQYPELGLSSKQLIEKVNVSSGNESQVMTLSMEDHSYVQAARMVNAIAEVFKNQIPTIMKVDNVTILNEANEYSVPEPIKPNPLMNVVISLILSFMLALGIVIILEYMDDSIKTEEDVKRRLGVPTLGLISKIKSKDMNTNLAMKTHREVGESAYVSANQ
ncbi:YveK family protein [Paenibacillus eucommiae]|uniref:Capsular polysaccharide biosynthesis protein n=1 Tax=Paenibacillus eucommiae TaxID=1355755 RepID=A0ABS4J4G5_9BACL|nr:Wzz/FepE/Etk N-terminal domain-containing protein [Paenibacillus eucommiae]MBP1993986.1 capsular polysaccharide biosynthesis protein [Paenibacillus eucommiae]